MRKVVLVALAALFFVLVWKAVDEAQRPRGRDHPWTSADDPFEPDSLRDRMERIAPRVSRAVGETVDSSRIRIRAIDDRLAAERAFARKFPELLDTTRDGFRQEPVADARARFSWRTDRLGSYDPRTDTIELYPLQFDSVVPDSIDALLDLVVAHELAHAWQDLRHTALDDLESGPLEASFARRAVIEGSAEFVARRVAQALGNTSVFDRLSGERDRAPDVSRAFHGTPIARRWFYAEGLSFVSAVFEAQGVVPDWERLFGRLPRTVVEIERPREWLESGPSPGAPPHEALERLLRELGGAPSDRPSAHGWRPCPIPVAAVGDRLAQAALPRDHPAWRGFRRGVSLVGYPDAGALADAGVSMRIWRVGTESDAVAARTSLEQAAKQRGARSWARRGSVKYVGPVRARAGRRGATAYAQAGMNPTTGELEEDACAFGNHGSWVFEATADCVGATPALLELIELAMRAWREDSVPFPALGGDERGPWDLPAGASSAVRDRLIARALAEPRGETDVTAWTSAHTDQPSALLTALGPALGDDDWQGPERGEALIAALRSADPDVVRFALHRLDKNAREPRPFAGAIIDLTREAARSANPEVRALAIGAAFRLKLHTLFAGASLSGLLADPSALVRAALARDCAQISDEAEAQLRGDDDPIVRAAAAASRSPSIWRSTGGFEWIARQCGASIEELRAYAELDALFGTHWDKIPDAQRRNHIARLRQLLASDDDRIRLFAIAVAGSVTGDRSRLVPGLLDAFASGPHRRAATAVLRSKDIDLGRYRSRLVRMLANPFTRVDALRVLAAHEIAVTEASRRRIRTWSNSRDHTLACAAALVLDEDPGIEQHWREVQLEFRCQVIDTVLRRRPDSALAARLREQALMSPYENERKAVYDALAPADYRASHWDALLTRIAAGGSEVAGEAWTDLSDRIGALAHADAVDAVRIVTRHLGAWCDHDRLPNLSWYGDAPYSWDFEDWPGDPAFLAALDRCIVRNDAPGTRLVLALVRIANTGVELPPAVSAEVRTLFAASPIPGVPVARDIHEAAVRCDFVPAGLLVELIRHRLDDSVRSRRWARYTRDWIGEAPERQSAARALVPELLERDTAPHVGAALDILSELGTASAAELDRLRELRARAMPDWRQKIDRCIAGLE